MNKETKAYQIIPGNGYLTIRLMGVCDNNNVKGFDEAVSEEIRDPFPYVVVNCEYLSSLSSDWTRRLLKLQVHLREFNKQMAFIMAKPGLKQELKKEGLDSAFKSYETLREALVDFGLVVKKSLDTDFINPFLSATLHVLKVQAGVNGSPEKIFVKKSDEKFIGDVSGVIGIVSESFNGSVVISFPEKTFLAIMSGMLGENYQALSKEILDGAGEITNMIFGQAKIVLNEKGYGIKTAIPSVVTGKDHSLAALTESPIVVVPFKSTAGDFFIEICIC